MNLLEELRALEVELHHPGVPCSRERLERLLHPRFHEIGRSGTTYDRTTVLAHLESVRASPRVESTAFEVMSLGRDHALLTYRSAQRQADGTLGGHTHRCSLWAREAEGWRLLYHQGTPAAEPW